MAIAPLMTRATAPAQVAIAPVPHPAGPPPQPTAPLGPLAELASTEWTGRGFNTIFRPNSTQTPTPLPHPVGGDNVLELNLTDETLTFTAPLGNIPNRGFLQGDIFLNGVPYTQSINDITDPAHPTGIHFEPGLWIAVPQTSNPAEGPTVARMASIPHGTSLLAQGNFFTVAGGPQIAPVDITPFPTAGGGKIRFPSQTATNGQTARIPQDLTPFIAAGTITQAILDDPNTVLRNAIAGQHIVSTDVIVISSAPTAPLVGGGTENIAFLQGNPAPNADAAKITAIFWIETVQHTIIIPPSPIGTVHTVQPTPVHPGHPVPTFQATTPVALTAPRTLTVTSKQVQYTQTVLLNFNGLSWPHVSVATLVPTKTQIVPPSAW